MSTGRATAREFLDAAIDVAIVRRLVTAAALTVLAFAASAALLALAGWFIASSAVAGLAVATTFSFIFPSAGIRALAVARTLGRYGERITSHSVTLDLVARLRTTLFARALHLPPERIAALRSADLLGRITVDTDAVDHAMLRVAFPVGLLGVTLVGATAFLVVVSVPVAALVAAGLVGTCGVLVVFARRQVREHSGRLIATRARARSATLEMVDGIPELVSFGVERQARAEVSRHLGDLSRARRRLALLAARGQAAGSLLSDLTLVGVVAVAAGLIAGTGLSPPAFVTVCLVTIVVFEPLGAIPVAVSGLAHARAAAGRLLALLPVASAPERSAGGAGPDGSSILHFEIPGQGVEITALPGETIVVTGRSGSGKSSLLRAIAGEGVPRSGVFLGGVDIGIIDPALLRSHIVLVAQDANVFDATIRDNLLLADARATDDELWVALRAVAMDDVVAALPAKLDTAVGPDGSALSGGQRRRLSVAQGMLRRPDIVLLDEPTEGLDAATAIRLLDGVRTMLPNALMIVALHDRQSTSPHGPVTARIEL